MNTATSGNSATPASGAPALIIEGLHASVPGREILSGVNITVPAGEVHAIMGPNGSGKSTLSHVLMGRPGYENVSGSVRLNGKELLGLPTWERAQAGLFLGMQYPTEVPGVRMNDLLFEAAKVNNSSITTEEIETLMLAEGARIGFADRFFDRALNVDLSGGEKKRNETVQLGVRRPAYALLDEIDSGLDVDALRAVSRRVQEATKEFGLGVLAITHYNRLLVELPPDVVHVFVRGRIVASGGPELALELEKTGYEPYITALQETDPVPVKAPLDDLFASPFD